VTREFIASHGLAERVTALADDFTRDPLPAGSDGILMASNLPQYSREIIQTAISRAFAALVAGGEMHLIGEMLDAARTGPATPRSGDWPRRFGEARASRTRSTSAGRISRAPASVTSPCTTSGRAS
jgi:hypothetical protein